MSNAFRTSLPILIAIRRYEDGVKPVAGFVYKVGEDFMIEEADGLETDQADSRSSEVAHRELCEYYRRMPELSIAADRSRSEDVARTAPVGTWS